MPAGLWRPDGRTLLRLREEKNLSQRELARLAVVDPQTVADIESDSRRVHARTLQKLAKVLLVHWEELLFEEREVAKRLGLRRLADKVELRSTLDLLWFANREKREAKVSTRFGALNVFGVAEMVDASTAPATFDGDRYFVSGEVTRQRPLSLLDEMIVDGRHLEGGRFEIAPSRPRASAVHPRRDHAEP